MANIRNAVILGIGILFSLSTFAGAKKYIVTLNSPQTFQMLSAKAKGFHTFDTFTNNKMSLFNNSSRSKIVEAFDNLEMIVIESDDPAEIEMLKESGIADFEEEMILPEPAPIGTFRDNAASFTTSGPVPRPWGIDAVNAPEAWSGANHGKGTRVLVLDTGIDRDHPAIKDNFEKGRNFMARNDDPTYEYQDVNGHGTHVSGTIAASGINGGLVGVAPQATLLMGRVCSGGCSTVAIIAGVDWGIQEKVDVMNLSLGGPFPSAAASKAYQRAEAANIVVIAASGNGGTEQVSFPAAFSQTYAVGAVDAALTKAPFSQWGPELNIVAPGVNIMSSVPQGSGRASNFSVSIDKHSADQDSLPMQGSGVAEVTAEVVFIGLGKPEDVLNLDLTGKIAIAVRGEISFSDKTVNAVSKGAIAVAIYNHEEGPLAGTMGDVVVNVPVVGLAKADGEIIAEAISDGSLVEATLAVSNSDYADLQGTSMASPHVAGVAALVRAANPSLTALEVRQTLSNSATPLAGDNSANQLGAGMVNAEAAVDQAISTSGFLLTGTD